MSQPQHLVRSIDPAADQSHDQPRSAADVFSTAPPCEPTRQVRTRHGLMNRVYELVYNNFIKPLVFSRNPPSVDARGVALGLAIGFLVPVGGQLASLAVLRMLFRFNYVVAAGFTLVSNPFNMIPLYYGYYCLGSVLIGKPAAINFSAFERLMNPIMEHTFFWEALPAFLELGSEILMRWFIAAVFLATVFGVVGYIVTYKIQQERSRRAAREMGLQYEDFLDRLTKEFDRNQCR